MMQQRDINKIQAIIFLQRLVAYLLVLCLLFLIPSFSFASDANYIYDDVGRLIKVISDTGDVATYNYDAVGNLLPITKQTINQSPPVLQNINPDIVFTGTTTSITITGANLFTTENITSDNAGISIRNTLTTDTAVTALLTISSDAPLGQANINITTLYGSASIPLTVEKLAFTPSYTAITPGSAIDITLSVTPKLSKDINVSLYNQNPDIISAPQSIVIPASGNAVFTVKGLMEGTGVLTAASAAFTIYVSQPLTGDATAATRPVSVYIEESSIVNGTAATVPVSVYIEEPSAVNGTTATLPVSVYIEETSAVNGIIATVPVSVYIEESTTVNAITVAPLVSAEISSQ